MGESLPREVVINMAAETFGLDHWPAVGESVNSEGLGGWHWMMYPAGGGFCMVLLDPAVLRQGIKAKPITVSDVQEFEVVCQLSRVRERLM